YFDLSLNILFRKININDLPQEIFSMIIVYLEIVDINNAVQVCKHWKYYIDTCPIIWKFFLIKEGFRIYCYNKYNYNHYLYNSYKYIILNNEKKSKIVEVE